MSYRCIFICDNEVFEEKIKQKIKLPAGTVFIKSDVESTKLIAKEIANERWQKAAYAHLTTFAYASKNGIDEFWNIDADDTSFENDYQQIAESLFIVEKHAKENKHRFIQP